MATTALGQLTLDLAVRMSDFSEGMSRAARETADRTREMGESVTDFKDTLLESLSGSPIGGAIDSLNDRLGSITKAFGENGLAGAAKAGAVAMVGAVAAMGAGVITLAMQTAESDKELVRLADRAKVSTQQFQVLAAATASYGVESEGLSDILSDVQEKLGEFSATGGGGLVDTLELIEKITGKTATEMEKFGRDLSTKDSVEAIQMVNDVLEEAGATTQEFRFANESLGSGLNDIIPVWANNGKVIAEYEQILEKAGVIRTKESIEQSAILANQASATKLQFQGLTNQLVAGALPALSGLVEYSISGSKAADGLGNSLGFVGTVANSATSFVIGLSTVFVSLGKTIGGVGAIFGSFFKMVAGIVINPFNIVDEVQTYLTDSGNIGKFIIQDVNKELLRGGDAINKVWNPPKAPANEMSKLSNIPKAGTAGIYDKSVENAEKAAEAAKKAGEKVAKSNDLLPKAVSDAILAGAKKLGVDPNALAAVISFETGGSFKTSAKNPTSSATGLIQFMEASDGKKDGKYYGHTRNEFAGLSPARQMEYVVKYLEGRGIKAGSDVGAIYDAVAGYGYKAGTQAYNLNKVWDTNGDGYVAKGEAVKSSRFKSHIKPYFKDGDAIGQANEISVLDSQRKEEEDRAKKEAEEEARRLAAGSVRSRKVFLESLSEYERIIIEGNEEKALAMYELAHDSEALTASYNSIEANTQKKLKDLESKVFGSFATDEEKLISQRDNLVSEAYATYAEGSEERERAIKAIYAAFEEDWSDLKFAANAELRKRQELTDSISSSMGLSVNQALMSSIDSQAQLSMTPKDYLEFSKQQGKASDYSLLESENNNRKSQINETDERGKFLLDENQRNSLLLEAHEEYLAKKKALDDDYAVRDKTLAQETALAKLDIAQNNISALSSLASGLLGQQSTAARAMFAIEKGLALQRIFLESKVALSKAWSSAAFPYNLPAVAMAALETGALASAVQTVTPMFSGVAHGGMDYIPSESTFLLDKGERVLSPRQNKDLTDFLSKGNTGSGSGETNITITIDNNGNANMNSDNAAKVSKEMSLQIKNLVQATLRQEKKQGGML